MLLLKLNLQFAIFCALVPIQITHAGGVAQGGNCSISHNHLDVSTHKLLTDCDYKTFCTPQNTCEPRQCRKDEYPFGYDRGVSLPPLCPQGQYCPDEGDACKPRLSLGQTCQLNRDDQCAAPTSDASGVTGSETNGQHPMSISGSGRFAANESICLHSTCMYANATLGSQCITDSTTYVGFGPKGEQFSNIVTRDNCVSPGLFCNATSQICQNSKDLGQACQKDLECESYNCGTQHVCALPLETPVKVAPWLYALTSIAVLFAMAASCLILVLAQKHHNRQRDVEIHEYYSEQLSYRRSIIALHSAAAQSRATTDYDCPKFTSPTSTSLQVDGCGNNHKFARQDTKLIHPGD